MRSDAASGCRLVQAPGVVAQELDGQLLLLREGGDEVLHLDVVASQIWRLLQQPCTPAEIARSLSAAYDVPADRVAQDVQRAVDVLRAHDLVAEM